jgi:hypothetical protein
MAAYKNAAAGTPANAARRGHHITHRENIQPHPHREPHVGSRRHQEVVKPASAKILRQRVQALRSIAQQDALEELGVQEEADYVFQTRDENGRAEPDGPSERMRGRQPF